MSKLEPKDRIAESERVAGRWRKEHAGTHYGAHRFNSKRAATRDGRLLKRLLRRAELEPTELAILDAPCGTGRLVPWLDGPRSYALDISEEMLREYPVHERRVRGRIESLPFPDRTFDLVVCCRLLHHVGEAGLRRSLVEELGRVSSRDLAVSFWDEASWPGWRRKLGWRKPGSRHPIAAKELEADLRAAGFAVLGYVHSMRFFSMQAFVLARRIEAGPRT